jgi:ethanolamine ammonia-lyase small subunit
MVFYCPVHVRRTAEGEVMTELSPQLQTSLLPLARSLTPARIFSGQAGLAYPTATQLALRADHAAAIDSVRREIDLCRDFDSQFIAERNLFEIQSQARDKEEYLRRPDLGRRLNEVARARLTCVSALPCDLQIVIGDGLSVAAVAAQAPSLAVRLESKARQLGWTVGPVFVVRYCRVGIMNDIGDLLAPRVIVLLIGERPGLATAESLSAYMAFRPQRGHTDANRNLISNLHSLGVVIEYEGD